MSADRCPSCAALVSTGAAWCSQCYADLRPAPPAPPTTMTPPPATSSTMVADAPAAAALDELPDQPLPGVVPAVTEQLSTWPCARCGTPVPFDDDECPQCHARFLASPLPGADNSLLDRLPTGQHKARNAVLVVVGGLVLPGVLLSLMALLVSIFH